MKVSRTGALLTYLGINLEVTLPGHAGVDGEFSWFVHNDASWLQAWTVCFHLQHFVVLEYDQVSMATYFYTYGI